MKSGTGKLLSFLLFLSGCKAFISSPQKILLEIRNIYDITYQEMYEELSLSCDFSSYPDIYGAFLTSSLFPQVQIRLPLNFRENLSEYSFISKQQGIRFSFFEEHIPRGFYSLIFQGKIGQEERVNLSLNDSFSLEELNSYFTLEGNNLSLEVQENERWKEVHINDKGQILLEKEVENNDLEIRLNNIKPSKETSVVDFEIHSDSGKIFVVRISFS